MIAGPAFLLDQHDVEIAGKIGGKSGTGNACPDDRHIGFDRIGQFVHPSRAAKKRVGCRTSHTGGGPYEKGRAVGKCCANAFLAVIDQSTC